MDKYRKFFVALVAPVAVAVWPFISDGWQTSDLGPVVVAALIALGVYTVPNQEPRVGRQVRS
jgi:hypothetical protein